jgi:hypothetical protein
MKIIYFSPHTQLKEKTDKIAIVIHRLTEFHSAFMKKYSVKEE